MVACLISGLALASATAAPARAQIPGGNTTVVGGSQLSGRGVIVNYPARGAPRLPAVPASAYVIADAGTGQVLAAKDPHGWFAPASTVGLIAGRRYLVSDLFKALLLVSANDAAISLAQATGSFAKGIAMMNAEAQHLGADDTVARQPNGLDAPGQHVSAYDEALIAREALKLPMFMRDEQLGTARFPLAQRHMVTLYNQNTMLTGYPGDIGGKIGWTTPAAATFIGLARRHGVTLIVTILHCVPMTEMTYAARLLNWGFTMDGAVTPVGTLVSPQPARTPPNVPRPPHRAAARPLPAGRTVPVAAGAGAALLAALLAGSALLVSRRRPRSGSRPVP